VNEAALALSTLSAVAKLLIGNLRNPQNTLEIYPVKSTVIAFGSIKNVFWMGRWKYFWPTLRLTFHSA